MTFDAVTYKATTKQQWNEAAGAWHRWGSTLEEWLGESTEAMLDAAAIGPGSRVLDVAGGAGGQALVAARRTGPHGRVLVTDLSPTILTYAERAAAEAGMRHVTTTEIDGEQLSGRWPQEFDAVICRLGLNYFPDQMQALLGIHSSLREGGRFAAIVYSTADRNGFFSVPVTLIREYAGLDTPAPGQPGPFSLGDPRAANDILIAAGFRDVHVQTINAPLRLPSAGHCVRFERDSFGALHQMLSGVPAPDRSRVWGDIEVALGTFETGGEFVGPCELHVLSGTR